jgi:phage shock protein PspC (stress-responsive transcriptional regulator)
VRRSGDARWIYQSINRGMTMNDIRSTFARQGLIRPRDGKILGGVCAGLGRRFGLTPWITRLLFVLLLMVVPGSQLLIYPMLWILMPAEETRTYPAPNPRYPSV